MKISFKNLNSEKFAENSYEVGNSDSGFSARFDFSNSDKLGHNSLEINYNDQVLSLEGVQLENHYFNYKEADQGPKLFVSIAETPDVITSQHLSIPGNADLVFDAAENMLSIECPVCDTLINSLPNNDAPSVVAVDIVTI